MTPEEFKKKLFSPVDSDKETISYESVWLDGDVLRFTDFRMYDKHGNLTVKVEEFRINYQGEIPENVLKKYRLKS